jgi:glutamate/tyrosine decarboxylase-like PLP-dependent enzyme
VDIHKYGYGVKGASVVLYRDRSLRRHQLFVATEWSGGIYASATMAGTRPAAPIASAWAVLNYLGWEGYLAITETVMQAAQDLRSGVADIEGVHILGDPVMSVMALGSDQLNPYEIGDELSIRGWHLDRQHLPPSLHMTVNYAHVDRVQAFLEDLTAAVERVRNPSLRQYRDRLLLNAADALARLLPPSWVSRLTSFSSSLLGVEGASLPERAAPIYGMLGTLPNRGDLRELVLDLVEGFTDT